MATIVFVVAKKGFRDEEYFIPKEVLITAGHIIMTASNGSAGEIAVGSQGGEAHIDTHITDIRVAEFDAVIFAGGPGAVENLDNEESYQLIRETVAANKLLGAICIAPTILAKAGALQGKNATVWTSFTDKDPIAILETNGAMYTDAPVVEDGNSITANSPKAAHAFGEALAARLQF
ncbi:MAG: DJ-1/PfpI family protein [Candidatus Azambacteria bacterium]|nr:DJ-1/PfpI family protein [Candidatus Azambacteria bacterium]